MSDLRIVIIACAISVAIGFYLGWHLHNERVTAGVLESVKTAGKIQSNTLKSSVSASESTSIKIDAENIRQDRFKEEHRKIQNITEDNVLDARLPDATIGLLKSASSYEESNHTSR
jgi:hypothetical protein